MFDLKNRLGIGVLALSSLVMLPGSLVTGNAHADGPAPNRKTARYEINFLKGMIDHHNMAVMMAELCEDRVIHHELLELCDAIIVAQSAEIEEMQAWLHDWYGMVYEPHMTEEMMHQVEYLASLHGAEFEIAFMQMMIEHHMAAIKEAESCLNHAYHHELIDLCHNIIETQAHEIKQMKSWLCHWYHICH